jgi:large subunit ribosomal protein L13
MRAIQKTYVAKAGEIVRRWYLCDADGKVLGRLAVEIARRLQGKHKPQYTPNIDCGDFIVVVNAEKVKLTGNKLLGKKRIWYTGYMHGLREKPLGKILADHPERLIERAVRRMLPRTSLGKRMFGKLKVYAGPEHPHASQAPSPLSIKA